MSVQVDRAASVRTGVRVEVFTVLWMILEAAVSVGAGIRAGSALLTAFGIDSVIELVSGAILLWRLALEARGEETEQVERAEHRAAWVVAIALVLLCLYVLLTAIYGLITRARPEGSLVGIVIAAAAVVVMPLLGVTKRRLAARLESGALRGDAASSFTCGYMAATVLLGVGLNTLFHWWWAEDVAALIFLFWLVGETREAFEEVQEGREDKDEDV
jgi:divalent metal cation (Fe/Co/Zn/Cd) transporter